MTTDRRVEIDAQGRGDESGERGTAGKVEGGGEGGGGRRWEWTEAEVEVEGDGSGGMYADVGMDVVDGAADGEMYAVGGGMYAVGGA